MKNIDFPHIEKKNWPRKLLYSRIIYYIIRNSTRNSKENQTMLNVTRIYSTLCWDG